MQEIEIDFFRPEDASGVARLFQEVYGEGYPVRAYYEPDQLIAENAAGRVVSSVARTETGEIVGHDALVLLDPATHLYENAAGAVMPFLRGQGIFFRIFKHSVFDAARRIGAEEIIGEPVCNHTQLQKMCLEIDYKESGLEVDLMPATAYTKEQSARGRVSVLLGYFRHKRVSRRIYLPAAYRNELEFLYAGLGVERAFEEPERGLPADEKTQAAMKEFPFAQVARIAVHLIGSDFEASISQMESAARGRGAVIFQVWLSLASPVVRSATDILRTRGYFIGGILPGWFGGDGLLMQKVEYETDWNGIKLYSERAKRIAEFVRNDQETAKHKV